MNRTVTRLLVLVISISLLSVLPSISAVSGQASTTAIKAYLSATPITPSGFLKGSDWAGFVSTDFASADGLGEVSFYVKDYAQAEELYAAFYVWSDASSSPDDYVALYLDMNHDMGSLLGEDDYVFVVTRSGDLHSHQGSGTDWSFVKGYPITWTAYWYDNGTDWGAMMVIPLPGVGENRTMGIAVGQVDYPSGSSSRYPMTQIGNAPSTWVDLVFSKVPVSFDASPRAATIIVDDVAYGPSDLPATLRWNEGTPHNFSVPATITGAGERYNFKRWSDGSNETARSFVVSGEMNLTAEFATEYYLAVSSPYGEPSGEGWYPGGVNASFSVLPVVDHGNGTRRLFASWTGDFAANASASVLMDRPRNVTALWRTQHYLGLNGSGGPVSGGGWYDEGSIARVEAVPVFALVANESRLVFTQWSGDYSSMSPSLSVPMDMPRSLTAGWRTQHYLVVNAGEGEATGEGWYDEGAEALLNATSPCRVVPGQSRLVFAGWQGASNASSATVRIPVTGAGAVNATWRMQYYLRVESPYGDPQGAGWYDAGTSAVFQVSSPVGFLVQQVFRGWTGDSTAATASASLTMDSAKAVIAQWAPDYMQLLVLIAIIVLLAVLAFLVRLRRRTRWE